ncbi:unnamed protein product, partial [Mesorhabditis belari]|uniref:Gustatory receptor n=1 Tax=Mesorhabditis belari TaxID=2138241 RepID=A0AAF3EUF7_9BILA
MAKNDAIVIPYYRPDLVRIAILIEMSSLIFLMIAVLTYIRILRRREFCHKNLLVLLLAHPCTHITFLLLRAVRHVLFFTGYLNNTIITYINFASDTCVSTTFIIVLAYSIERVIAMKYVHTYEQMWVKWPTLGITLYVASLLYSLFLIILWNARLLNNLMTYGAQYFLFTTATIFFISLRIRSGKIYRSVADKKDSTVNERYLSARNLKAAKLLIRLAPFKCITNYFSLAVYFWCFEMHSPFYFPLYSSIYFFASHIQLYVQMLLTIYGHTVLKEEFRSFFGGQRKSEPEEIYNVLGNKMIFNKAEQNEVDI